MPKTVMEIPQDLAELLTDSGQSLPQAIASAVVWDAYTRGVVSAGRAAKLLGMERVEFEENRVLRGVSRPSHPGL